MIKTRRKGFVSMSWVKFWPRDWVGKYRDFESIYFMSVSWYYAVRLSSLYHGDTRMPGLPLIYHHLCLPSSYERWLTDTYQFSSSLHTCKIYYDVTHLDKALGDQLSWQPINYLIQHNARRWFNYLMDSNNRLCTKIKKWLVVIFLAC